MCYILPLSWLHVLSTGKWHGLCMQVLEVHETNAGRDPFPAFIGRGPMPKPAGVPSGFAVTSRVDRKCAFRLRFAVLSPKHFS